MKTNRPALRLRHQFYIVVLFFGLAQRSIAQETPVFQWAKQTARGTGDEYSTDVTTDAAGNVFSVGASTATADYDPGAGIFSIANANVFISKLDINGNFLWAKGIAATGVPGSQGSGIVTDASGNVYVTGTFMGGTVDFDPGLGVFNLTPSGRDLYVLKLDGNGDFVWARSFNLDYGNGIAYDPAGFIYVTSSNSSSSQCSVIKLDTDGNSIWTRTITGGQTGGVSVSVDPTGNVIATGWLTGTADFDPSAVTLNLTAPATETGLFIWKLNGTGDLVWANQLPRGNVNSILLFGSGSSLDAMGNIYLSSSFRGTQDFDLGAGTFTLTAVGTDVFVCKLDNSGNFVWAQSIDVSVCNFLSTDGAGNSYITGSFTGTADFDPSVGIFNQTSAGNDETYILKLNPSGNFVWATRTGSPSGDEGTAIHADASGNVYLTSYFYQFADFDPTCGSQTLNSGGNADAYIQKLSSALAPTITSFSPITGSSGTTVTIAGVGFSTIPSNNTVRFFNNRTATVTASTATSITAIVPASTITGVISVTTNCLTATSATNFTISTSPPPTITSFTPSSGPVGTMVTITGTNFDPIAINNTVVFNGTAAVVTASTITSITTTVPTGATTGTITVTVAGNTATSATNFTVTAPLPTIISFTPTSGPIGTTVTITGTNFSTTPANNTVAFNGSTATVTASTTTSITTTVPAGATTGKISATVGGNIATSTNDYTVTTSGGAVTIVAEALATSIGGTVTKNLVSLITTLNNNLDLNSIIVTVQPPSGAVASVSNGLLTVDYTNIPFSGKESLTIRACDTNGNCTTQQFEIEVAGDIVVYNGISPNNDAQQLNEKLILQYIDILPETQNNQVTIYSRWGDAVWEGTNYNNDSVVFTGKNNNGNELPSGTYFYKVQFNSNRKTETGYLVIKK